jgi:hypothetical protein
VPYQPHDVFEPPRPNAPILRYMDFVKFVWLLDRASLYFTRVDKLGDRFEGSMSRANHKARDTMDPRVVDAERDQAPGGRCPVSCVWRMLLHYEGA